MARKNLTAAEFGYEGDLKIFLDLVVDCWHGMYPNYNEDELLLRPQEAIKLCDAVRLKTGLHDLPNDVILRPILNQRKRG